MTVWISLFFLILAIRVIVGKPDTDQKRKKLLIITGALIALTLSLRGDHGGATYDYRVYVSTFEQIAQTPWESIFSITEFEYGFVVLCKLLSFIWKNGQTIVIFESVFCVFSVCRFIYKNTNNVFESLFFFVTIGSMGFLLTGLRQAIAIGILLFGIEAVKAKKPIRFLLVVALAATVHLSAVVFVFVYIICNSKFLVKHKSIYPIIVILLIIFSRSILDLAMRYYPNDYGEMGDAIFSFNGIINIILYTVSLISQLYFSSKSQNDVRRNACTGMITMGLGLYMFRFISMVFERTSLYYTISSSICLSDIYVNLKKQRYGYFMCVVIIMLCFILYVRRIGNADYGNYVIFFLQ